MLNWVTCPSCDGHGNGLKVRGDTGELVAGPVFPSTEFARKRNNKTYAKFPGVKFSEQ